MAKLKDLIKFGRVTNLSTLSGADLQETIGEGVPLYDIATKMLYIGGKTATTLREMKDDETLAIKSYDSRKTDAIQVSDTQPVNQLNDSIWFKQEYNNELNSNSSYVFSSKIKHGDSYVDDIKCKYAEEALTQSPGDISNKIATTRHVKEYMDTLIWQHYESPKNVGQDYAGISLIKISHIVIGTIFGRTHTKGSSSYVSGEFDFNVGTKWKPTAGWAYDQIIAYASPDKGRVSTVHAISAGMTESNNVATIQFYNRGKDNVSVESDGHIRFSLIGARQGSSSSEVAVDFKYTFTYRLF